MIGKNDFIQLIQAHQAWEKRIESVEKMLGISSILDVDWIDYSARLFEHTLEILFNEEGVNIITWWLFELEDKSKDCMWDKNGKVIPMKTIEDLWNYVKEERI